MRYAVPIHIMMKFGQDHITHPLLSPRRMNTEAIHFIDGLFLEYSHVVIPNGGDDLRGITNQKNVIASAQEVLFR